MTQQLHKTLFIIDGYAQIYRAYHAIRDLSSPITKEPTNATFGFVGTLLKIYKQYKPDYIALTLDVSSEEGTFRSQIYPEYKANRTPPPDDLFPQIDRIIEIAQLMSIPILRVPGFEADDLIATICDTLKNQPDIDIRIISNDKDLLQLLSENVAMLDVHKDRLTDIAQLRQDKGVTPEQIVDMLSLMGDTSDNIPGVKGIGPKTASKLIEQYNTIENVLAHIDQLKPKQQENINTARDNLTLNRKLITLQRNVPLEFTLESAAVTPLDTAKLDPIFRQLGFTRHLHELHDLAHSTFPKTTTKITPKITTTPDKPLSQPLLFDSLPDSSAQTPTPSTANSTSPTTSSSTTSTLPSPTAANPSDYSLITTISQLDDVIKTITALPPKSARLSVDTETTSIHPMLADLCGISLAWQPNSGVYIPVKSPDPDSHLNHKTVIAKLKPILEDPAIPKLGQNLKYDINVLYRAGINLQGITFDTLIASALIDPSRNSHKLDHLALAYINYQMIPISDLIGSGKKQTTFDTVPLDLAATYAAEDADVVLRLHDVFAPMLDDMDLTSLFNDLEIPLITVLAKLEYHGITVNPDELDHQRDNIATQINSLREQIKNTADSDFSPDSTKQLADVFFTKMKCRVIKRGKTGPSTDSQVLLRIAEEEKPPASTLADLILQYRQLTKLMSTYLGSLKAAINPNTHRIHASFNQTGAATGRLSSSNPNLQNIPIRTEVGRQIRKAFIAPPDHLLLSADYSQIELRVLAHLSNDENLRNAFINDLDIHTAVAAKVFNVPVDQVTPDQRASAKMVNFGIVYGITPFGLARRLNPNTPASDNVQLASQIINDYKASYPRITTFLEECVHEAQSKGYVQTILKRQRPIPQINSTTSNIMNLGRRMAINSVVQGSAADLIKIAMVNIQKRIENDNLPLKMILQIHDELVFETPIALIEQHAAIVRSEMTNAMALSVPLKVDIAWSDNWMQSK